jgi:hypothetical protein
MHAPRNRHLRACVEIGFIVFLFYANLLMGEFTGSARHKTFTAALVDIFTMKTIAIAILTAIAGHFGFMVLREKS